MEQIRTGTLPIMCVLCGWPPTPACGAHTARWAALWTRPAATQRSPPWPAVRQRSGPAPPRRAHLSACLSAWLSRGSRWYLRTQSGRASTKAAAGAAAAAAPAGLQQKAVSATTSTSRRGAHGIPSKDARLNLWPIQQGPLRGGGGRVRSRALWDPVGRGAPPCALLQGRRSQRAAARLRAPLMHTEPFIEHTYGLAPRIAAGRSDGTNQRTRQPDRPSPRARPYCVCLHTCKTESALVAMLRGL